MQDKLAQALEMMKKNLGDALPSVMPKMHEKDPKAFAHHLAGKQYSKPPEGGALDEASRALIHMAAAITAGAGGCAAAMARHALDVGASKEAVLEAAHIAQFAASGAALETMEAIFDEV